MENFIIKAEKEQQGKERTHMELLLQGHVMGHGQRQNSSGSPGFQAGPYLPQHPASSKPSLCLPSAPLNSVAELQRSGGSANSIYPSFVNLLPSPEPCGCSVLLATELGLFGFQRGNGAGLGCCTEPRRCHPKNNLWSQARLPGFKLCPTARARQLNTSETY